MAPDAESTAVSAEQHCINLLGLSRRAESALRRAGIHTIEALAHLSDADLLYLADVGPGAHPGQPALQRLEVLAGGDRRHPQRRAA